MRRAAFQQDGLSDAANVPPANENHGAALNDDDAVDLLTQTQHISGRSEEQFHSLTHERSNSEVHEAGNGEVVFPESLEPLEEVARENSEVFSEDDEDENLVEPNGPGAAESQAVQTQGLVDLEAFMDGEEDNAEEEEEVEEPEELEGEGKGSQIAGHLEPDGQQELPEDAEELPEDDVQVMTGNKASLGDAAEAVDLESETVETQEGWNIRKGKSGPLQPQQIIRGATRKRYVFRGQNPLGTD